MMILAQVERYNQKDPVGHLYGAIIASIRDYIEAKKRGRYAEYHIWPTALTTSGTCHNPCTAPYIVLQQAEPHEDRWGVINDGILNNLETIKIYPIEIKTEEDLAGQIAWIANLSMALGYKLENEGRILSKEEAY